MPVKVEQINEYLLSDNVKWYNDTGTMTKNNRTPVYYLAFCRYIDTFCKASFGNNCSYTMKSLSERNFCKRVYVSAYARLSFRSYC